MNSKQYFKNLGLTQEESEILNYLTKHKRQSILQISRGTAIERTKIYRVIDNLLKNGFIVQSKDYKSNYYSVASPSRFWDLKEKKHEEAKVLENNWAKFVSQLTQKNATQTTDVRYYKGREGIKQILWNELQADKEIRSFTYRNLQDVVSRQWFKKWAKEVDALGIILKDLRTHEFDKYDKTKKFKPLKFKADIIRYLPKKYKDFYLAVDIYNDIVVLYDWRDNEVFAVEIQNKNFAKFMKTMFDEYWEKSISKV